MRKTLAVLFCVCAAVLAQDLPKIAVYVTGDDINKNEKTAFGAKFLETLAKSGHYSAMEDPEPFLGEIDMALAALSGGAIGDRTVCNIAKTHGLEYVCIADIAPAEGEFKISARIIKVEAAEVVITSGGALKSMSEPDLEQSSSDVVGGMFRVHSPAPAPAPERPSPPPPPPPPPSEVKTVVSLDYLALSLYGGPSFGTDAGTLLLEIDLGFGLISANVALIFYPDVQPNNVFNPEQSLNDTSDASYWGLSAGASFTYASPGKAVVWNTGPAIVIDFGGMVGNRHTYIRPAAQTKIDIRIHRSNEEDAGTFLRLGYRIDAFYKETAKMFGKFKSNSELFATHSAFAGITILAW